MKHIAAYFDICKLKILLYIRINLHVLDVTRLLALYGRTRHVGLLNSKLQRRRKNPGSEEMLAQE